MTPDVDTNRVGLCPMYVYHNSLDAILVPRMVVVSGGCLVEFFLCICNHGVEGTKTKISEMI